MPKEQLALDASPADAAVLLQEAERPAKPLDAKTISKMNSWQLRELIGPKGTIEVGALRDWLLVEAPAPRILPRVSPS